MYIYIYIHTYMFAVGSITWPHFSHFRVNSLATIDSIAWPHRLAFKICGFRGFLLLQFSERGAMFLFGKLCFVKGFSENGWSSFFWGGLVVVVIVTA